MKWQNAKGNLEKKSVFLSEFIFYNSVNILYIFRYEAKIAGLYQLPDKFKVEVSKRSEEMLSNQMLSGIPEVDLGLE